MNELALSTITINGAALDLGDVLADVTIRHGRTGYFDSASPSTCQLTLLGVTRALTSPFRLGSLLAVNATDGATDAPRFTGRFTDATLDGDALTAIAVSSLRTLPGYALGGAFPEEKWSARVARAFNVAGLASTLKLELGAFDPVLVAEDAPSSPRTLGAYLDELAGMVDAAVADLPDGRVLVQAIDSRKIGNAFALDPAQVGYAPQWELRLPEANTVTVSYGPDSASSITATDLGSVALYGPIAAAIETTVRDVVDANAIGTARIATNAYARWTIGDAPLLVGRRLAIGTPVKLSHLPAAAPHDPWTPLLEGWTDHVVSDGERLEWTMELALSDPLLSGLTIAWQDVPVDAAHQWNTINQTTAWRDALSLDALDP